MSLKSPPVACEWEEQGHPSVHGSHHSQQRLVDQGSEEQVTMGLSVCLQAQVTNRVAHSVFPGGVFLQQKVH